MKIIATILAVAVVSIAGTYAFVTSQKTAERGERTESDSKKYQEQLASMRTELNAAKARKPNVVVEQVVVPGAATGSPQEILDYLSKLDMSNTDRRTGNTDAHRIQVRQVIRQFEALTAMGTDALPTIEYFLSQNLDLEYKENTSEIVSGNWSEGRIYPDPIFPPSLRIGLLNTVRHIGKRDAAAISAAEHVLLSVLNKTRRGIEVAYIAQSLEDIAPEVNKEE